MKDDYYYVNFGQNEERYGDNTKGYYYVDLPDNRRQMVNYYVDGYSGYVAEVKYEGEPKYSTEYKQGPTEYKPVVYTKPEYPKK